MAYATLLTLAISDTDEEGTIRISLIVGGSHRGGVTEARWATTGGFSKEALTDMAREVVGVAAVVAEGATPTLFSSSMVRGAAPIG